MASGINWTDVIVVGIPAWIAALGAATAAVIGALNSRKLKTSNGTTIAEHVEATHATVTENTGTLNAISETQASESA
jgi:hypothetical protein